MFKYNYWCKARAKKEEKWKDKADSYKFMPNKQFTTMYTSDNAHTTLKHSKRNYSVHYF